MSGLDIEGALRDHVLHAGGGNSWFAECLAPDCEWSEQGTGGLMHGIEAHRAHVAAVLREEVAAAQAEARADERARITAGIKRERDNYYTDTQNEGFDVAGRIARNGGHL